MTAVLPHGPARTVRPAPTLVSLLSGAAQPFYAALAGALPAPGVRFEEEDGALSRLLTGQADLGALCGLLYLRHRRALRPLVAPVSLAPGHAGPVYFASIVVREGGSWQSFEGLSGARWALNERASFSGWVALLAELRRRGLPLDFLGQPRFTGGHLASLGRVRVGLADVTAVDSTVLDLARAQEPALAGELRELARLGPYPAPPIAARRDLPPPERARLVSALTSLHTHEAGRRALALGRVARFVPVREADYAPILAAEALAAPLLVGPYG